MKTKSMLTLLLLLLTMSAQIVAQGLTLPQASPMAHLTQKVGITDISVVYSRPAVKEREVWGKLVPFDSPWRAGANENTVVSFSHDVQIQGKNLAAGTYGLHMLPSETGDWTVMFSSNSTSWGSYTYDPAEDVLRVNVTPQSTSHQEVLTYDVIPHSEKEATLALSWEKKMIPLKVSLDTEALVLANMQDELRSLSGFSWQGWNQIANYCLQHNMKQEEALTWSQRAVNMGGGFTAMSTHAGLLKATGKADEAGAYMEKALAIANVNELNNYGYQLLGQGKHDEAVKIFQLNAKNHPDNANIFDSLGEGLALRNKAGDKAEAIKAFKKSLSMNPPEATRQNSLKYLRELGVEYDEGTAKKN